MKTKLILKIFVFVCLFFNIHIVNATDLHNGSSVLKNIGKISSYVIDVHKFDNDLRPKNIYSWRTKVVWKKIPKKDAADGDCAQDVMRTGFA